MSHAVGSEVGNEEKNSTPGAEDLTAKEKFHILTSNIQKKTKAMSKQAVTKSKDRLALAGQLKQARISFERFLHPKIFDQDIKEEEVIPKWVLSKAKGIVFLTVIKAGFLFAGNVGTGVVITRRSDGNGWSGPASVAVAGVSVGFLAGASKTDYIMILPNDMAVKQFTGKGQLRIGGEIQVAAGPVGRDASGSVGAGDKGVSAIFSYSHAQGLYGGLALDGKVISVRPDCNATFYKKAVTCEEILSGAVEPPPNEDYETIVHLLESYCKSDISTQKNSKNRKSNKKQKSAINKNLQRFFKS